MLNRIWISVLCSSAFSWLWFSTIGNCADGSPGSKEVAGALGFAIVLTQVIDKLIDSKFGDMAGKWKLTIVTLVSTLSALFGQMAMGQTFVQALMSSAVLTAGQVFIHQILVQFSEKKEPSK